MALVRGALIETYVQLMRLSGLRGCRKWEYENVRL